MQVYGNKTFTTLVLRTVCLIYFSEGMVPLHAKGPHSILGAVIFFTENEWKHFSKFKKEFGQHKLN